MYASLLGIIESLEIIKISSENKGAIPENIHFSSSIYDPSSNFKKKIISTSLMLETNVNPFDLSRWKFELFGFSKKGFIWGWFNSKLVSNVLSIDSQPLMKITKTHYNFSWDSEDCSNIIR